MSWFYRPYVSVAQRRAKGQKTIKQMQAKGQVIEPLGELLHRTKIATSFWGRAWCDHLESFSDYENRLPRGRTYVRNGSVLHLSIEPGKISALVQGSELYRQTITIKPLPAAQWTQIKSRCRGGIGSLIELLQGKISSEIMAVVTDSEEGLFPKPKEIHFDCSCPDWAGMCKHIAAVLYGVGARLDTRPELLFKLRGVDHNDLIESASESATLGTGGARPGGRRRTLAPSTLGAVFGVELDDTAEVPATPEGKSRAKKPAPAKGKAPKAATAKPISKKAAKPATARPRPFQPTGAAVRKLRQKLQLSKAALASRLGVSGPTISNWENKQGPLQLQAASLHKLRALHQSSDG